MKAKRGTGYQLAEQRKNIIRKIRRLFKFHNHGHWIDGCELIEWIQQLDERYQKKRGGLGR